MTTVLYLESVSFACFIICIMEFTKPVCKLTNAIQMRTFSAVQSATTSANYAECWRKLGCCRRLGMSSGLLMRSASSVTATPTQSLHRCDPPQPARCHQHLRIYVLLWHPEWCIGILTALYNSLSRWHSTRSSSVSEHQSSGAATKLLCWTSCRNMRLTRSRTSGLRYLRLMSACCAVSCSNRLLGI